MSSNVQMSSKSNKSSKENISEENLKNICTEELEKLGNGGIFVWSLFFLCVLPNILNGFHVSSYTLLGHLPDDQWCVIDELQATNWTIEQQLSISQKDLHNDGCTVWNWNYEDISKLPYEEAMNYTTSNIEQCKEVSCKEKGSYGFKNPETTFVAEWDLVCERSLQRTSAQMFISCGKFFGSFSFGIFADKYGRKSAFVLGALLYITSSFMCTFSPWYSLFLAGRFGLGSASSGLFYPAFTMIVENICLKHRSWMSIAFSASYPVGMIILAVIAFFVRPWRELQLALTIPALLLILNCYFLHESPRWLITTQKYNRAYKILFKKKCEYAVENSEDSVKKAAKNKDDFIENLSLWTKLKEGPFKQFFELFATWKVRKLILSSYFMFCVTSLSYYVTALNAANLQVSRFLYVGITGIVDIPSYLVPVIMLKFTGRRTTTMTLFFLTGVALLMVLAVPEGQVNWIIAFAMVGRFGISATYSVLTLYTAELYPTEIRNSALGTCSTFAHIGSISSPYVVDILGKIGWFIPTTICGCCVLVAGLLCIILPETGTKKLTDHIEDAQENIEKKNDNDNEKEHC